MGPCLRARHTRPDTPDLYIGAYSKIANPGFGVMDVRWRQVECAMRDTVKVRTVANEKWYWAITVRDVAGPGQLKLVEIKDNIPGGPYEKYRPMKRAYSTRWEANGLPKERPNCNPCDLRITDVRGEVIEAKGIIPDMDGMFKIFDTKQQFSVSNKSDTLFPGTTLVQGEGKDLNTIKPYAGFPKAPANTCNCTDVVPPSPPEWYTPQILNADWENWGCALLELHNKCNEQKEWMLSNGYCKQACGWCYCNGEEISETANGQAHFSTPDYSGPLYDPFRNSKKTSANNTFAGRKLAL